MAVAGRMMLKRVMGKACFATLQDMSGRIQLYVTLDGVGAEALEASSAGTSATSSARRHAVPDQDRRAVGQVRPRAPAVEVAAAAAGEVPRPDRPEQRYRQRYVDLITNPESREVFVKRSQIVQAIREFFVARGYLEVETPMMHPIPGGAAADPSSPTTTRSTCSSSCASRRSSTSSGWSSAGSRRCSRSTATSGTRASRPGTTPSSRCSSSTRRTATTTT